MMRHIHTTKIALGSGKYLFSVQTTLDSTNEVGPYAVVGRFGQQRCVADKTWRMDYPRSPLAWLARDPWWALLSLQGKE